MGVKVSSQKAEFVTVDPNEINTKNSHRNKGGEKYLL